MSRPIKILHIDPDYQVTYLIYRPPSSIRTAVPLETAIEPLKKKDFDLILSEPHNQAILKKEPPLSAAVHPFWGADHSDFREVRQTDIPRPGGRNHGLSSGQDRRAGPGRGTVQK